MSDVPPDPAARPGIKRAMRWSMLGTVGSELIGFTFLILLARLLSPAEYGLLAMVGAFFAMTRILVDSGLSHSLVQRNEISADDETTVFYANIAMGTGVFLLLFAIAPLVAAFFNEPRLTLLMQVLALKPLLASFAPVQQALLIRDMDFRSHAVVEVTADLIAGIVTVGMALLDFGVWSLVGQALVWASCRSLMLWVMRPWRPRGRFRWANLRSMWPFSSRLLATSFIDTAFDRSSEIVIGRLFSAIDLGLFTRARQLQRAPTQAVVNLLGRVSFGSYSKLQDDPARLLAQVRRMQRALAFFNAPAMFGLAAVAVPLTLLLLSAAWIEAAPFLAVFAGIGLFQPLLAQRQTLLTSIGRSDVLFRLAVARHALTVIILVATWRFGALAVAAGIATQSGLALAISAWLVSRHLAYPLRMQAVDILPGFGAGALAGLAAWYAGRLLPVDPWVALPGQIVAGGVAWMAVVFLFRRGAFAGPLADALAMIRRKKKPA